MKQRKRATAHAPASLSQTSNDNVVIYLFSISAGDFQHAFGQIYEFLDMGISCTVHGML